VLISEADSVALISGAPSFFFFFSGEISQYDGEHAHQKISPQKKEADFFDFLAKSFAYLFWVATAMAAAVSAVEAAGAVTVVAAAVPEVMQAKNRSGSCALLRYHILSKYHFTGPFHPRA
jgi:hypothetical protein